MQKSFLQKLLMIFITNHSLFKKNELKLIKKKIIKINYTPKKVYIKKNK